MATENSTETTSGTDIIINGTSIEEPGAANNSTGCKPNGEGSNGAAGCGKIYPEDSLIVKEVKKQDFTYGWKSDA